MRQRVLHAEEVFGTRGLVHYPRRWRLNINRTVRVGVFGYGLHGRQSEIAGRKLPDPASNPDAQDDKNQYWRQDQRKNRQEDQHSTKN